MICADSFHELAQPMSLPTATSRSTQGAVPPSLGPSAPDGRIPIVLGVTGHRTLRAGDEDAITARLRTLLALIKAEAPSSPILLLSALAEGADRLVARVALREGAQLIAVLPLEKVDYETGFCE